MRDHWREDRRWTPQITPEQRAEGYAGWQKAIQRTLDWVEV
jgi:glycerol kinase